MNQEMIEFDRVTDILKPFSGIEKVPAEILSKASARGTAVHTEIQALQKGLWTAEETNLPEEYKGYITSYTSWAKDKKFIQPERFYEYDLKITGECDALYLVDSNTYSLVDFKTSSKMYGKSKERMLQIWGMQLTAYSYMADQAGYPIERIELVQLNKFGESAEVYDFSESDRDCWKQFFECMRLYRMFFKNIKNDESNWEWI